MGWSGKPQLKGWRLGLVLSLLAGSTLALGARLGQLQIVDSDLYREKAAEEHWAQQRVMARRATIRDRNGYPLATSVAADVLYIKEGEDTAWASRLGPRLGMAPEAMVAKAQ